MAFPTIESPLANSILLYTSKSRMDHGFFTSEANYSVAVTIYEIIEEPIYEKSCPKLQFHFMRAYRFNAALNGI